jgi:3-oxoacyl-[acyl-carrier protein] reductase
MIFIDQGNLPICSLHIQKLPYSVDSVGMAKETALVTGVGRKVGIAAEIARQLAMSGWDLVLTYWTPYDKRMPWGTHADDPLQIKKSLESVGAAVFLIESNLEQQESPTEIFRFVVEMCGSVSALILCHCESVGSGILTTSVESFDRHFSVNARASWQLIKEFANQIPADGGRIVALTSDHMVHNVPYGASKGALDRIVIAAARELAHLNITANVINPGPIDTGWMDGETRVHLIERQPSGRLGLPGDVANLISFLVSPAGSWINGQLIKSDGGFSA